MRIEVKGRNLPVSEDLREHVAKRFRKVERQVSELAELEVEVFEERNPAIADSQVAEATLHLKGVTLRARDASPDIMHSINLCADELQVQVKRHRDKRRKRREQRAAAAQNAAAEPAVEAVEEAGAADDSGARPESARPPKEGANGQDPTATLAICPFWTARFAWAKARSSRPMSSASDGSTASSPSSSTTPTRS